jgi:hypothetical protein
MLCIIGSYIPWDLQVTQFLEKNISFIGTLRRSVESFMCFRQSISRPQGTDGIHLHLLVIIIEDNRIGVKSFKLKHTKEDPEINGATE